MTPFYVDVTALTVPSRCTVSLPLPFNCEETAPCWPIEEYPDLIYHYLPPKRAAITMIEKKQSFWLLIGNGLPSLSGM